MKMGILENSRHSGQLTACVDHTSPHLAALSLQHQEGLALNPLANASTILSHGVTALHVRLGLRQRKSSDEGSAGALQGLFFEVSQHADSLRAFAMMSSETEASPASETPCFFSMQAFITLCDDSPLSISNNNDVITINAIFFSIEISGSSSSSTAASTVASTSALMLREPKRNRAGGETRQWRPAGIHPGNARTGG